MKLVIAEKPSVAMALAKVLKARQRKNGYMEGNGFLVSWCIGHLVGLCDAAEYDERYRKWRYEDLPICPDSWKTKILDDTKEQFSLLKKLMNDPETEEVICATDAGKEGELIFRLVYEKAGCTKPVKRLWISSLEEKAIKEGFDNMKDGSCYDDLYQSAYCRAKADWLVGINASRLFSVLYNKNLKIGRVQTPTLAMIVERNQKIQEFVKEKFYEVHLKANGMMAVSKKYEDETMAKAVADKCRGGMCQIVKDEKETKTIRAPKLYDLTTLQREANRLFGYTAKQTLDAAQSLYESKLITYPRTDSQYLTDDMGDICRKTAVISLSMFSFCAAFHPAFRIDQVLDSSKVSDHHAILPTLEVQHCEPEKLKQAQRDILLLICARVLTALEEPYIYVSHKCSVTCNGEVFSMAVRQIQQEGFRHAQSLYLSSVGKAAEVETEGEGMELPESFGPCASEVMEKYTQPPRQFTEDTILAAMEKAGNEELTEEAERKGLGTPATRAGIIEKLVNCGLVKREKKNLVPTDEGIVLITIMPDEIKSPKMTAQWENQLTRIAKGEERPGEFLDGILKMMEELTGRYKGVSEDVKRKDPRKKPELGKCPRCGSPVVEGTKNYYCTNRDCRFSLWKNDRFFESQGKKMDVQTVRKLLKDGKIYYKNLRSRRTGKSYAGTIVMADPGDGYVQFNLLLPQR